VRASGMEREIGARRAECGAKAKESGSVGQEGVESVGVNEVAPTTQPRFCQLNVCVKHVHERLCTVGISCSDTAC
jgi:hypothetical protein